jgi:hypothetical protein
VDDLILVAIVAGLLVLIAIIAYLIFKDRGNIEHVGMLEVFDSIKIFQPDNEENPDLKGFDDRF